ncbi:hypothetical protein CENSYa_0704 [Cenarchaeum symbiosum A]|uniref:Uncharacterized protein n=1 Tax=Cenarchaeum symbiosum (strain A) TaxID=414004 RepID=A0RVH0_CENSY|nr:hypothetical protein CENSYa_0704 [Cenarchaeum symbiosum A]
MILCVPPGRAFCTLHAGGLFYLKSRRAAPCVDEYLRAALLVSLMAPMAISDLRERTISNDTMYAAAAAAACLFAYDLLTGAWAADIVMPNVLAAAAGCAVIAASRRGLVGLPDGILILVITLMLPQVHGIPVALWIILAAYILGAAYSALYSIHRNISDWMHGRDYSRNIVLTHVKKKGERFAMRPGARIGAVEEDTVRSSDGEDLFIDEDAEGEEAATAVPMVTAYLAGTCIVLCVILGAALAGWH